MKDRNKLPSLFKSRIPQVIYLKSSTSFWKSQWKGLCSVLIYYNAWFLHKNDKKEFYSSTKEWGETTAIKSEMQVCDSTHTHTHTHAHTSYSEMNHCHLLGQTPPVLQTDPLAPSSSSHSNPSCYPASKPPYDTLSTDLAHMYQWPSHVLFIYSWKEFWKTMLFLYFLESISKITNFNGNKRSYVQHICEYRYFNKKIFTSLFYVLNASREI